MLDQYSRQVLFLARWLGQYERHPATLRGSRSGDTLDGLLRVLSSLAALDHLVDQLIRRVVRLTRADGASWARIGEALGTSRQAAYERFSPPRARRRVARGPSGDERRG